MDLGLALRAFETAGTFIWVLLLCRLVGRAALRAQKYYGDLRSAGHDLTVRAQWRRANNGNLRFWPEFRGAPPARAIELAQEVEPNMEKRVAPKRSRCCIFGMVWQSPHGPRIAQDG